MRGKHILFEYQKFKPNISLKAKIDATTEKCLSDVVVWMTKNWMS